jgi:dUTP pyrophosphatase
LFCPSSAENGCLSDSLVKIDFQVKCKAKMVYCDPESMGYDCTENPTGFYMYPRSSLSKTALRLANSVGIIDAGYRGNLIGMFDLVSPVSGVGVDSYQRLVQICAPGLVPIYVEMVSSLEELGTQTQRGEGGFGSTGK